VNAVAFNAERSQIVSGDIDRKVRIGTESGAAEVVPLKGHAVRVPSVVASAVGSRVVSGGD
jgi:hypothetical protein